MEITVAGKAYRIVTVEHGGRWIAHAVRVENGEPFGIDVTAATAEDAAARLERWLEWQQAHTDALEALQQAERAYHRAMADAAFSAASAGSEPGEERRASLEIVDAARARLDEIRAQRPAV
jgi:hypothetical protein